MRTKATVIAAMGFALLATGLGNAGATPNAIALCDALEGPNARTRELALRDLSTAIQHLVAQWAAEAAQPIDAATPLLHDATCHLYSDQAGTIEIELNVPNAVSRWYRVVIPVQGDLARFESAKVVKAGPDPA